MHAQLMGAAGERLQRQPGEVRYGKRILAMMTDVLRRLLGVLPPPTEPGLARVPRHTAQVGQARLALGEGWGGGQLLLQQALSAN